MSPNIREHTLGWIGLGRMGEPLAERLHMGGANVAGYNRTRAKTGYLQKAGMTIVDRPADLADRDIVFTMVATADDLREVLVGPHGLLTNDRKPALLVDLTTVSPEASKEIRELVASCGTQMLVLPVSGNDVVVRSGKLRSIASGPREAFDMALPYLSLLGSEVTYVGEGDVSRIIKICHNLLLGIVYGGLAEVSLLAEKKGVPRHVFLEVINRSVLGSVFSRYKTPVIANLDYSVTFTNRLMLKDFNLGLTAANEDGVWLPITETVSTITRALVDEGAGEDDYTRMLDKIAQRSGMKIVSEKAAVSTGLE